MFRFIRTRRGANNNACVKRFHKSVKLNFDPLEARETPAATAAATVLPMAAATYGSMASLQAVVTPNPGAQNGTLSFYDNGNLIAGANAVPLDANGVGTFQISHLSAGDHAISAVYNGGAGVDASPMSSAVTETINPAPLFVTGITVNDMTYSGNTNAALNTNSATLVGVVGADEVTLNGDQAMGRFADKNAGQAKPVSVSGLNLNGAAASNYTLMQPALTGNITRAPLTVGGITASDRTYDATNAAAVNVGSAFLNGRMGSDDLNLNVVGTTGTFNDPHAGVAKPVTISGVSVSGADVANYDFTQPTTTATINPLAVNVTGITANNKPFDNSTMATLNTSQAMLQGIIAPDMVNLNTTNATGTFASANAGNGINVAVNGLTIDNPDYTLNPFTNTADITSGSAAPVNITVNGDTGPFAGPQQSRVVSLKLDFGQSVQLDQGAVTMALHTNNVSYDGVAMPTGLGAVPTLVLTPNGDGSSWTVTFSGPDTDMGADGFASLEDGVYDVTVNGAMVHPTNNPTASLTGTSTTTFAKLFGKTSAAVATPNGASTDYSAAVNSLDNLAFRTAFNNDANYKAYLDFDGNGVINSGDNLAFRQRFNKALTWTA